MSTRASEIRTYHDLQAQADLERMLKARRDAEAARAARFRRLPTPQQPEPVQMCAAPEAESEPLFTPAEAVIFALFGGASVGVFVADVMGWLP